MKLIEIASKVELSIENAHKNLESVANYILMNEGNNINHIKLYFFEKENLTIHLSFNIYEVSFYIKYFKNDEVCLLFKTGIDNKGGLKISEKIVEIILGEHSSQYIELQELVQRLQPS